LLQLPGSWTEFLSTGTGDASCLGPMSGLEKHRPVHAKAAAKLTDPTDTRLVLVSRAQASSFIGIKSTFLELTAIGISGGYVVVNGVLPRGAGGESIAVAMRNRESTALGHCFRRLPP